MSLTPEKDAYAACGQAFGAEDPGVTFCNDGREAWIVLRQNGLKFGVIAHEALHAVNFMFKCIGHVGSPTDDEITAYYLEDLVDQIHAAIEEEGILVSTR